MRIISLTKGMRCIVDDCDYDILVSMGAWHFDSGYARKKKRESGKNRTIYMHRVIMDAPDSALVDHINGDTLDNRRSNLRICTAKENAQNRRQNRRSRNPFKGVFWHEKAQKWQASIGVDGRSVYIGLFDTAEQAADAYNAAASKMFSDFACLNDIDRGAA